MAASTVHRIERGDLRPTVETLVHIVEAAGSRLTVGAEPDYGRSLVGLARAVRTVEGDSAPVRMAAEFVSRDAAGDDDARHRMITARPPPTGAPHRDAFLGGLAEWLAVRFGQPTPEWTADEDRFLDHGWWVTPMASMRAWEYAGSPASFQSRGVYLHRDSLTNV